jgi:hypothetical protein
MSHDTEQRAHKFVGNAANRSALLLERVHGLFESPVELVGNQQDGDQDKDFSKEHMGLHRIVH